MFFSCHKIGGPFGTGIFACTNEFFSQYLCPGSFVQDNGEIEVSKSSDDSSRCTSCEESSKSGGAKKESSKEESSKEESVKKTTKIDEDDGAYFPKDTKGGSLSDLLLSGTFNLAGFMGAAQAILNIELPNRSKMYEKF